MLTQYLHKNAKNEFKCECGRNYKHRQSLHKHQKDCKTTTLLVTEPTTNQIEKLTNLVFDMVKQKENESNNEVEDEKNLLEKMVEMIKKAVKED